MSVRRKVWTHRGLAALWVLLAIPGTLWWRESILFVILASLYANAMASWSASEAADDRGVCERLERIERRVNELLERRNDGPLRP